MPSRNAIKPYVANGYYHVYNRGVEKRVIFADEQDYAVFLSYLANYLTPKDESGLRSQLAAPTTPSLEKQKLLKLLRMNNFHNDISLLSYCLMPNHFHFFVKQTSKTAIDAFMNSLLTRYVMYFNKKYQRIGPLFEGVYKAALVETEPYFLYLSAYIHRNPLSLTNQMNTLLTQSSSYPEYLGQRKTAWVKPEEILSYFSQTNPTLSYQAFVEQTADFSLINEEKLDHDDLPTIATSTRPPFRVSLQGEPLEKVAKSNFFRDLFS